MSPRYSGHGAIICNTLGFFGRERRVESEGERELQLERLCCFVLVCFLGLGVGFIFFFTPGMINRGGRV